MCETRDCAVRGPRHFDAKFSCNHGFARLNTVNTATSYTLSHRMPNSRRQRTNVQDKRRCLCRPSDPVWSACMIPASCRSSFPCSNVSEPPEPPWKLLTLHLHLKCSADFPLMTRHNAAVLPVPTHHATLNAKQMAKLYLSPAICKARSYGLMPFCEELNYCPIYPLPASLPEAYDFPYSCTAAVENSSFHSVPYHVQRQADAAGHSEARTRGQNLAY